MPKQVVDTDPAIELWVQLGTMAHEDDNVIVNPEEKEDLFLAQTQVTAGSPSVNAPWLSHIPHTTRAADSRWWETYSCSTLIKIHLC